MKKASSGCTPKPARKSPSIRKRPMTTTVTQPEISRNAALPEPLRSVVNGISPGVPAMERKPIQAGRREKSLPLTASELFRRNSIPPEPVAATHPLYEIAERARALETEIIGGKVGSTEVLVGHLLTMNMLVRGLIAVAIAEMEVGRGE